jgi:hypothetical protein
MPHSTPSMNPASANQGGSPSQSGAASTPAQEPPAAIAAASSGCGCSKGQAASSASLPVAALANASMAAPSLKPGAASAGGVAAAWHSNVHVSGLWSVNQDRNSWVHLDNGGWKRLSAQSISGVVALTMVAAHAYENNSVSSLYEGDDGQISQLYVW